MINNITYWLEETGKKFPDNKAFVDEKKSITYKELISGAKAVASGLIKRNIFKQPISVYLEKSVDEIVAFMGAAYSGNFYSPIDVEMPVTRINKLLATFEPACIITDNEHLAAIKEAEFAGEIITMEELTSEAIDAKGIRIAQSRCIDTDLLYVLFTSGSTGNPKGVGICHRSVVDYIDWVVDTFNITEKDSFGNQAPFYFDNSVLDIYSAIRTGATVHIIPKILFAQPVRLLAYIQENSINTVFWVPSVLIMVARFKALTKVDLNAVLKRVLFAGEVMPNKQLNVWRSFLPNAVYANLYGPTEITVDCTCYIVDREFDDDESLPIGTAIPNSGVLVLNEENKLVAVDEVGELCVRGTSLAVGYYNNPEKTAEVFVQNPLNDKYPELIYRTGDLVKYNDRGEILYISRKDFQIKHMGHRIELGEIEMAALAIEEVSTCCCIYDEEKQRIIMFVDNGVDEGKLKEHLNSSVPNYMMPSRIVNIDEFPINANGKIDRKKLKELL